MRVPRRCDRVAFAQDIERRGDARHALEQGVQEDLSADNQRSRVVAIRRETASTHVASIVALERCAKVGAGPTTDQVAHNRPMLRPGLALAALPLAATLLSAQPAPPQHATHDLTHTVRIASAWTERFTQNLSGLLFREKYLQKTLGGAGGTPGVGTQTRTRELLTEANVFLLYAEATREFVLFRDVYIVNGRDITNHTARLQMLLADGSDRAVEQAKRLTDASAAFNMGSVNRNVNIPTMGLRYLGPGTVNGVRFKEAGRETVQGLDTVIVDFEEFASPTLVRGTGDTDVRARGRYWIHTGSGSVPRAHVDFAGAGVEGRMEIDLMMHPQLSAWVPKEMTEVWRALGQRITGLAQYDRYQRLTVSTGEIIRK